jgi:hypothetical protein
VGDLKTPLQLKFQITKHLNLDFLNLNASLLYSKYLQLWLSTRKKSIRIMGSGLWLKRLRNLCFGLQIMRCLKAGTGQRMYIRLYFYI